MVFQNKVIYQIVAKSILSQLFTGLFKRIQVWWYKNKLANLLTETATEYKQHFPKNNSIIGTPFYESQFVLEALLKKYFFDIRDLDGIKEAIKNEKGILTPFENELKCFLGILERKVRKDTKLKTLFIQNEHKREVFNISAALAQLKKETTLKLQEIIEEAKRQKVITQDLLSFRFQLNRVGWLKERYLPELHKTGKIENKIEELLYSEIFRKAEVERLKEYISLIEHTKELIGEYLELTDNHELDESFDEIVRNFDAFLEQLYSIKRQVAIGNDNFESPEIEEVYLWDVKLRLVEIPLRNRLKNLKEKLANQLEEIHRISLKKVVSVTPKIYAPHNLIVSAPAGSGKTHALANAVQKRIESGLPALIIDSQSVNANSWKSIFIEGIGLSSNWDELEIFNALNELGSQSKDNKILIALDGLDEVGNYKKWKIRVNELIMYLSSHVNIRFVVACRNYVPKANLLEFEISDEGIGNRMFGIYKPFDNSIQDLFPIYFTEYKVDISDTPWIPYTIDSKLELRLFCEEYKGQRISPEVKINISSLLRGKIQRVEKEIFKEIDIDWIQDDHIPQKMLIEIAKFFFKSYDSEIERETLIEELLKSEIGKIIDRNVISQILEYFSKYDLLLKIPISSDDSLVSAKYKYQVPFRSFLELLISQILTDQILTDDLKDIPEELIHQNQILEFTAISLLSEHEIMVGENGLWANNLSDHHRNNLQIRALAKAGFSTLEKYKDWIADKFTESERWRSLILAYIIIPGSRIPKFPIGGNFIHELLSKCSSVYERDLIWSGYDYSSEGSRRIGGQLLPYYSEGKIVMFPWKYELNKRDSFDGLPLIFAWSLTSIENVYREHCRKELCNWALQRPDEFLKLLDFVFNTNDPQMKEDLVCVVWGLAALCTAQNSTILNELKDWALINIFKEEKLLELRSPIIRQAGRNVVERAYDFGLASDIEVLRVKPPFMLPFAALDMDEEGLEATNDGIEPISNDLAWYVIKKAYEPFLPPRFPSEKMPHHIQFFYKKHFEATGFKVFGNHGFVFSAALGYIKKLGWENNRGYLGYVSSRSSKSKIATFEEKYTWCAVHHIMGYLSDYLPAKIWYHRDDFGKLTDYYKLLNIPNPAHLVLEKRLNPIKREWIFPTDLTPNIDFGDNLDKVAKWIHEVKIPDFKSWLKIDKKILQESKIKTWDVLYNDTSVEGSNGLIRKSISSNMYFIEDAYFNFFRAKISKGYSHYFEFPEDSGSQPNVSIYISPKDICSLKWLDDIEDKIQFYFDEERTYDVYKSVSKLTQQTIGEGEEHLKIPSKFTRDLIGIMDGDGTLFLDDNEQIIGFNNRLGKPFKDGQEMLLVDSDLLNKNLRKRGLRKIWFISIFKDVGLKARQDLEFYQRHKKLWLVWEDGNEFKYLELLDDDYKSHLRGEEE